MPASGMGPNMQYSEPTVCLYCTVSSPPHSSKRPMQDADATQLPFWARPTPRRVGITTRRGSCQGVLRSRCAEGSCAARCARNCTYCNVTGVTRCASLRPQRESPVQSCTRGLATALFICCLSLSMSSGGQASWAVQLAGLDRKQEESLRLADCVPCSRQYLPHYGTVAFYYPPPPPNNLVWIGT